ncbi:MAG: hypothetical protein FJX20_23695 [Alphaproteobacteria bacterium]|nr:hypothetical protein [Alphaproteobacteria bacterium]
MADKQLYWFISGYEDSEIIFQCAIEQERFTDTAIIATLRCLVSRHLGPEDIVVANMDGNALLDVRQHEPNPQRVMYSCGEKYQYTAALVHADK